MKTMSADELRAHALRTGAEVVIGGKPFNTQRAQIQAPKVAPKPAQAPSPPPAPVLPPEPTFSRADVERLLAEQERRLQAQFQTVVAMLKASTKTRPRISAVVPTYDAKNAITLVQFQYHP